jgi:hypothetical protein
MEWVFFRLHVCAVKKNNKEHGYSQNRQWDSGACFVNFFQQE